MMKPLLISSRVWLLCAMWIIFCLSLMQQRSVVAQATPTPTPAFYTFSWTGDTAFPATDFAGNYLTSTNPGSYNNFWLQGSRVTSGGNPGGAFESNQGYVYITR